MCLLLEVTDAFSRLHTLACISNKAPSRLISTPNYTTQDCFADSCTEVFHSVFVLMSKQMGFSENVPSPADDVMGTNKEMDRTEANTTEPSHHIVFGKALLCLCVDTLWLKFVCNKLSVFH